MKQAFVYVTCGPAEHIDMLNLSLRYLREFSRQEILVVTDSRRNEVPIEHDRVLDVETPTEFNDKQASIYLKTGLFKFLDEGPTYCYLDSDILALNDQVDAVFDQPRRGVAFATDHCRLPSFSASAIHCGCREKRDRQKRALETLLEENKAFESIQARLAKHIDEWTNLQSADRQPSRRRRRVRLEQLVEKWRRLEQRVAAGEAHSRPCFDVFFAESGFSFYPTTQEWRDEYGNRVVRSFDSYFRTRGFRFDVETQIWRDLTGRVILGPDVTWYREIEAASEFRYDQDANVWRDSNGDGVFDPGGCEHLAEEIQAVFQVEVADRNWRHWNGGMYVFDRTAHDFLEFWHESTLTIFKNPRWAHRDQGTLVASAWKFQMNDAPTLPIQFNFIADYYSQKLWFDRQKGFSFDGQSFLSPNLVHIYHEWGRADWDVWQWVVDILPEAHEAVGAGALKAVDTAG